MVIKEICFEIYQEHQKLKWISAYYHEYNQPQTKDLFLFITHHTC